MFGVLGFFSGLTLISRLFRFVAVLATPASKHKGLELTVGGFQDMADEQVVCSAAGDASRPVKQAVCGRIHFYIN